MTIKKNPPKCPSESELQIAQTILHDQFISIYQTLYYQNLTGPGDSGEFRLVRLQDSPLTFHISHYKYPGFYFRTKTPTNVLSSCNLILAAIKSGKLEKPPHSCCPLASSQPCVCSASFNCPIHGSMCYGSHD